MVHCHGGGFVAQSSKSHEVGFIMYLTDKYNFDKKIYDFEPFFFFLKKFVFPDRIIFNKFLG